MSRLTALLLAVALLLAGLDPHGALADRRGGNHRHQKPVTPADLVLPVAKSSAQNPAGWFVVETDPAAGDPGKVAQALAKQYGLTVKNVYRKAMNGFAAKVPDDKVATLRADPAVVSAEPDQILTLVDPAPSGRAGSPDPVQTAGNDRPQVVPWGVARIEADQNRLWQDAAAHPIDAGVAVIDTGIDRTHPDLNVAGGVNCSYDGDVADYQDHYGHGTHVSGTAAAKDNGFGVVGVAPGARLYGVKVLGDNGGGSTSTLICGVEWVIANADQIDVANLSLGGTGNPKQEKGCAAARPGSEERALCNLVDAGVALAVAAGNECRNARFSDPAMFDVAITVGAFADDDGRPGGLGGPTQHAGTCGLGYASVPDDTLAPFTNYGSDVDIWAPGVGILSTVPTADSQYNAPSGYDGDGWSGTSMATPHVAGSIALWAATYRAAHAGQRPTVQQVRAALLSPGGSGRPGAESALLVNSRYHQSGSKKMPSSVQALIVNDNPTGPWPGVDGGTTTTDGPATKHHPKRHHGPQSGKHRQ